MTLEKKESGIEWDEVIKKEARGTDDSDFGEVQEIGTHHIVTKKGLINKEEFCIPKYLVRGFDGDKLWFDATEDDLAGWKGPNAREDEYYLKYRDEYKNREVVGSDDRPVATAELETKIPLIEERLNVSKSSTASDVRVTKRPVTETKNVEVPVTHEELVVERRPASGETTADRPVQSETDTTVQLNAEQVHVSKEPYVKEEVALKKKPVTETKQISEEITKEEVDVAK